MSEKIKLLIASPTVMGLAHHAQRQSFFDLGWEFSRFGISVEFLSTSGSSHLPSEREHARKAFLESDCTHILFLDADLKFTAGQVFRLLKLSREGFGCIGAPYRKKCEDVIWTHTVKTDIPPLKWEFLRECSSIGMGFLLVDRATMLNTSEGCFTITSDPYTTEDFLFCQHLAQRGIKIYVDLSVKLGHVGNHTYTGDNYFADDKPVNFEHRIEARDDTWDVFTIGSQEEIINEPSESADCGEL